MERRMKSLFVLQLFFIYSPSVLGEGLVFRNDYLYNKEVEGFLKYHEVPANWHDARLKCYLEGATLASPVNDKMASAMTNTIKQCEANHFGIFTGIHSTFSKGDYRSVEGVPLSKIPHKWQNTEPNNQNDSENCIIMQASGSFADVNCKDTYPYMCYKKTSTVKSMDYNCGTTDDQYLDYVSRTGSCYKVHTDKRNWTRAYMACEAEGAHLIIINNETEAEVVKELFQKYKFSNLKGTIVFAGYHDFEERGDFLTIHGQTLKEAGYTAFEPGQPDNYGNNQPCGGLFASARLDDMWCNSLLYYICEKNPDTLVRDDVVKSCRSHSGNGIYGYKPRDYSINDILAGGSN
ncbi:C-type mannose receptor 2-like [Hyposmocoma kahamanoa]|uniref:C-type mannose receptor 2-like n=1 Tax=Hyposmocoma kahamanoa TaxID=1477025 RepID=UPI000E6D8D8B|nr:C-type mannose receptor 2-like [Hyposmocoma kahamanoa]